MGYLRIAVWISVAGALAWAGWTVAVWRNKAARADDLAVLYQAALGARVKADAATRHAEQERDAARAHATQLETEKREAEQHERVQTITKRVIVKVPADRECDLNADVVELLNNARAAAPAAVPAPSADPAPAAAKPEGDPWWKPF